MSSFNMLSNVTLAPFSTIQAPPGLVLENYAWVDKRLQEMTYNYALTAENCFEFDELGLLNENWSWVDTKLEELCQVPLPDEPEKSENDDYSLASTVSYNRRRAESDISEYESEISSVLTRLSEDTEFFYEIAL